ncbi:hypothetical protein ACVWYG_003979, partial [Pedobacter sp. UYEF25]
AIALKFGWTGVFLCHIAVFVELKFTAFTWMLAQKWLTVVYVNSLVIYLI